MARPRGEVRRALEVAVRTLAAERGPVSCRAIAEHAQVGYDAARMTLENMERAGQVRIAGHANPPGRRWHILYQPVSQDDDDTPQPWGGIEALASAVKGWVPES